MRHSARWQLRREHPESTFIPYGDQSRVLCILSIGPLSLSVTGPIDRLACFQMFQKNIWQDRIPSLLYIRPRGRSVLLHRSLAMVLSLIDDNLYIGCPGSTYGQYNIYAPCALCPTLTVLTYSHTITFPLSCRLNRMPQPWFKHSQTRRSFILNNMQHLTSELSMVFEYIFFAAFGKYTWVYLMTQFSCHVTPALLVFDSFLTAPLEIMYIWHRKPKLGSILYILARYPTTMLFLGNMYLNLSTVSLQVWILSLRV